MLREPRGARKRNGAHSRLKRFQVSLAVRVLPTTMGKEAGLRDPTDKHSAFSKRTNAQGWRRHRDDLDAHRVFRDFELARPMPDGSERYVQVSGEPVFGPGGEFCGYRGVAKDVTEHRLAENALRHLNADLERRVGERTAALEAAYRELEAFSYSVSHDLRAPLRAISGFSSILREDEGERLSEEGRAHLATIDASARRMGNLTDALLSLARTS